MNRPTQPHVQKTTRQNHSVASFVANSQRPITGGRTTYELCRQKRRSRQNFSVANSVATFVARPSAASDRIATTYELCRLERDS